MSERTSLEIVGERAGIGAQAIRGTAASADGVGMAGAERFLGSTGAAAPTRPAAPGAAGRRTGSTGAPNGFRSARVRERNDQDAATVLAVVLALTGRPVTEEPTTASALRSVWGDPAFRVGGAAHPSPVAWWASAMPR